MAGYSNENGHKRIPVTLCQCTIVYNPAGDTQIVKLWNLTTTTTITTFLLPLVFFAVDFSRVIAAFSKNVRNREKMWSVRFYPTLFLIHNLVILLLFCFVFCFCFFGGWGGGAVCLFDKTRGRGLVGEKTDSICCCC